jgi:hypothetical protein
LNFSSVLLGDYTEGQTRRQGASVTLLARKAKELTSEAKLSPLVGDIPEEILNPLLQEVIDRNLTLLEAAKETLALKAEGRMAKAVNKEFKNLSESGVGPSPPLTWDALLAQPSKETLVREFKGNSILYVFCCQHLFSSKVHNCFHETFWTSSEYFHFSTGCQRFVTNQTETESCFAFW